MLTKVWIWMPIAHPHPDEGEQHQYQTYAGPGSYGTLLDLFLGEEGVNGPHGPEQLGLGHLVVVEGGLIVDPGPGQQGLGVDNVGGGAHLSL